MYVCLMTQFLQIIPLFSQISAKSFKITYWNYFSFVIFIYTYF